jgi:uncharacterized integral membrane protein (TIGR00697 family)
MQTVVGTRERAFVHLAALFIAALVVCNLVAQKFVTVDLGFHVFTISAGILPYPLTFLVTDLISEIYGRKRANQLVFAGFVASVFVLGVLALGAAFPAIPGSPVDDAAYTTVFGQSWKVVFSSMLAYLVAQLVDIRMFHFWKRLTNGRHLWLRNNASTLVSQLVDTTLVVTVLFLGTDQQSNIPAFILSGWLFKALCALLDTPLFYLGVWWFERHAPEDRAPHTMFN